VRAYALDARGVEREVASSEFRVEAGGLIRYVGDTTEPSESSGVLVSSVAAPVNSSSQLTIPPPSYDRGIYDGGTLGGPITQWYTVDPSTGQYVYTSAQIVLPGGYVASLQRDSTELPAIPRDSLINPLSPTP
jgi:hypothetical protein